MLEYWARKDMTLFEICCEDDVFRVTAQVMHRREDIAFQSIIVHMTRSVMEGNKPLGNGPLGGIWAR